MATQGSRSQTVLFGLVAAVCIVAAIVIVVVFDSPTSTWLLLGIVFIGLAMTLVGSRSGRG